MGISAKQVKELRDRTGAGMMECKKALVEADGDIEAAIEAMRKSGLAKAAKRSGRIAAEGRIVIRADGQRMVMAEVNCETDFVSKGDEFREFAETVADVALGEAPRDVESLLALPFGGDGQSIDGKRQELVARIGENMTVRRFTLVDKAGHVVGSYLHGDPHRIGVIVVLDGGDEELARDIAMHVAASRPLCVSAEDVPAETLDKEKEIIRAQAADSGKPPEIVEKMIGGRLRKYLNEVTLLGQPFVKDPDTSVGKLLDAKGATVVRMERFEVGEGIEKKTENFADEVMAQVKGG